ncbi:MAG: hypothetical protein IJY93_10380 [Clostridia bacterium]|nr:hypothetical protein [Clostridia bacterium]
MKKFFSFVLTAIILVSCLAISTAASVSENGALRMGTAVIDGVLDDAYTGSLVIKDAGKDASENQLETEWNGSCYADIYVMYDNEYLYLFAHVTDDDLTTRGKRYATSSEENPTSNDCIEFRLILNGLKNDQFKCSIDGFGYNLFGLPHHYEIIDYSTFNYKVITNQAAGTYDVELAVPCTKGTLDLIKCGELGLAYQLNDVDNSGITQEFSLYTSNRATAVWTTSTYKLTGEKAVPGAVVPVNPYGNSGAVTTTEAPETTAAPETTPAPVETTEAPEADTTAAPEDTTAAPEEVEDTTAAEAEDTTTAAEVEDTTVEGEDTTAEGEDTTVAEESETTEAKDEDTTVEDTTAEDDKGDASGIPTPVIIGIVAAVVVIAGVAIMLSKKKKN